MLFNLAANNFDTKIGQEVVKRAKLTKGMWLLVLLDLIVYPFILGYSKVPILASNITISSKDLTNGFYMWTILNVILLFLFALPEIIARFRYMDKIDK